MSDQKWPIPVVRKTDYDALVARLAEAEALLKSAKFAAAIASTYSIKPEAKAHYRELLEAVTTFLSRENERE